MENGKQHMAIGIITTVCRFVLAVVFIFSGFVKAIDPLGTQYKIQDYFDALGWAGVFPDYIPFLALVGLMYSLNRFLLLQLPYWGCWSFV